MTIDEINYEIFKSNIDTNDISDGCHTFGQLYFQRMMLFSVLVNLFSEFSWKTKKHEDGKECFGGGWFLVSIDTPYGTYGYHYEMKYWDLFKCPELLKAKHWDGYTEENVDRLNGLIAMKNWYSAIFPTEKVFAAINSQEKTCGRCIHDEESADVVGSSCYLCKLNPKDNRIDWFEERKR